MIPYTVLCVSDGVHCGVTVPKPDHQQSTPVYSEGLEF